MCVGHKAKRGHGEYNQSYILQQILPTDPHCLAMFGSYKGHQAQSQVSDKAVSGLSHPPQVVWQALSHSSKSWKKAYPCATWQRAFLLGACAIFSCTAYVDFLTLFPVWLPPRGLVDLIFNWLPTSNLVSVICQALDAGSLFRLMALDPYALWM